MKRTIKEGSIGVQGWGEAFGGTIASGFFQQTVVWWDGLEGRGLNSLAYQNRLV